MNFLGVQTYPQIGTNPMRTNKQGTIERVDASQCDAKLDLVVPFTTTGATHAALAEACRLASTLGGQIRLVRIQIVPYPLQPGQSPVDEGFLRRQMEELCGGAPVHVDLLFARDFGPALRQALGPGSVVVL